MGLEEIESDLKHAYIGNIRRNLEKSKIEVSKFDRLLLENLLKY